MACDSGDVFQVSTRVFAFSRRSERTRHVPRALFGRYRRAVEAHRAKVFDLNNKIISGATISSVALKFKDMRAALREAKSRVTTNGHATTPHQLGATAAYYATMGNCHAVVSKAAVTWLNAEHSEKSLEAEQRNARAVEVKTQSVSSHARRRSSRLRLVPSPPRLRLYRKLSSSLVSFSLTGTQMADIQKLTPEAKEMYKNVLVRVQAKKLNSKTGYCVAAAWLDVPQNNTLAKLVGPRAKINGPTKWRDSLAALCAEASKDPDWRDHLKVSIRIGGVGMV